MQEKQHPEPVSKPVCTFDLPLPEAKPEPSNAGGNIHHWRNSDSQSLDNGKGGQQKEVGPDNPDSQ